MREARNAKTQRLALEVMCRSVHERAGDRTRLLDILAGDGRQTLRLRDELRQPTTPMIYDGRDRRDPMVAGQTDFRAVDLERDEFPTDDGSYDIVVFNRDLVTVKRLTGTIAEVHRVLTADGLFIVSVPNLSAWHNRILLLSGRQPTTLHIDGDHVRGLALASMLRFCPRVGFRVLDVVSIGLHPFTSALLPRAIRGLGHTVVLTLSADEPAPALVRTGLRHL